MRATTKRSAVVSLGQIVMGLWLVLVPAGSQAVTVAYSYDAAGRLVTATYGTEAEITYTYDGAGNILTKVVAPPSQQASMVLGWNLLGLYKEPVDTGIVAILGNKAGEVISVWKWLENKWAVYLPGQDTSTYAASKGFSVLQDLHAGEGFWVNSNAAQSLTVPGVLPADPTLNLVAGWNLVSLKGSLGEGVSQLIAGKAAKVVSLWKWKDNAWAVYLPQEMDGGAAYAQGKGFALLDQIGPGEGFWVNCAEAMTME